jgi:predicted SAM-dependent methyltransferase
LRSLENYFNFESDNLKLHLGCGHKYLEGWINIDGPKNDLCYNDLKADVHANIVNLEYPDNSVDAILMEAVFEHFPRHLAIIQLRKFYKWLKPGGKVTILVPDFWGTVKMLKKSKSPQEKQFWFRHIFGPQDTIKFGTHYDAFDVEKLKWMFKVVGFNKCSYKFIKRWPSIRFAGVKEEPVKSDSYAKRDIIKYMANYEAKEEAGLAFGAWMKSMKIEAQKKPETPVFHTQEMYKQLGAFNILRNKSRNIVKITLDILRSD